MATSRPEALVARAPDLTHPTRAQPLPDGVGADSIAGLDAPAFPRDLVREDIEGGGREKRPRAPPRPSAVTRSRPAGRRPGHTCGRGSPRAAPAGCSTASRKSCSTRCQRSVGMDGRSGFGRATPARRPSRSERSGRICRAPRPSPRWRDRRRSEAPRPGPCAGPPGRASGEPRRRRAGRRPAPWPGSSIAVERAPGPRSGRRVARPVAGARCPRARGASSRPRLRRSARGSASGSDPSRGGAGTAR